MDLDRQFASCAHADRFGKHLAVLAVIVAVGVSHGHVPALGRGRGGEQETGSSCTQSFHSVLHVIVPCSLLKSIRQPRGSLETGWREGREILVRPAAGSKPGQPPAGSRTARDSDVLVTRIPPRHCRLPQVFRSPAGHPTWKGRWPIHAFFPSCVNSGNSLSMCRSMSATGASDGPSATLPNSTRPAQRNLFRIRADHELRCGDHHRRTEFEGRISCIRHGIRVRFPAGPAFRSPAPTPPIARRRPRRPCPRTRGRPRVSMTPSRVTSRTSVIRSRPPFSTTWSASAVTYAPGSGQMAVVGTPYRKSESPGEHRVVVGKAGGHPISSNS